MSASDAGLATFARVLVADGRRLYAEAIAKLVRGNGIEVVAVVSDMKAVPSSSDVQQANVIVLGGAAPAEHLLDVVVGLRARGVSLPVLLVTDDDRPAFVRRSVDAKVEGLVSINDSTEGVLRDALQALRAGRRFYSRTRLLNAMSDVCPLNDREIDVLRLALIGKTSRQISSTIFMSSGTVRNLLSGAIKKLEAKYRIEAARVASERGWL